MFKFLSKKLRSEKGEAYVGEGVKIVVAIVLGAALLAGLVLVANKVILPKTEKYIIALFDKGDDTVFDVTLDSMGVTEETKTDLRLEVSSLVLMQTEEYRQAESVCNGEDAELLVGFVVGSAEGRAEVTREELDAMFEGAQQGGDEYQVQIANSYFALRDRYDSEAFQTQSNGFTRDYMKHAVKYDRGELTDEEFASQVQASGEKWGIDTSDIVG